MMSEKEVMPKSIHPVSRLVNTARIENTSTIRIIMPDDRDDLIQARADRLKAYRLQAGFRFAAAAAKRHRWPESTYRSHENGTRPIGDDDADRYAAGFSRPGREITGKDIMYGPSDESSDTTEPSVMRVPVMGMIGAGASIEPEFEQIPADGLHQVELPFAVPDELIAFEVDGDSMLPAYEDGDVILVWKEQRRSLESFFGKEAAVRTSDGRRYIKRILYGKSRNLVNLHSFNAKLIENVRLEWIGEIYSKMPADQINRIEKRAAKGRRKGTRIPGEYADSDK